jgi:hypothetical protein
VCAVCYPQAFVDGLRGELRRLASYVDQDIETAAPATAPAVEEERSEESAVEALRSARAVLDRLRLGTTAPSVGLTAADIRAILGCVRTGGDARRRKRVRRLLDDKISHASAAAAELRTLRKALQSVRRQLEQLSDSHWELVAWYLATGETWKDVPVRGGAGRPASS